MIFIIEEDIVNANDIDFLECLDHLLIGYKEGSHLLYIKPRVVENIHREYWDRMDIRTREQFTHYEEKFMYESKIAFKLVNYAIKIVPKDIIEKVEEKTIENQEYEIGYLHTDKFLSTSKIQKTILLGENPNDGDIYEIIANEYIKRNESRLKVKLKIENGGGSTTAPTFLKKIGDGDDICLCILDSDKKFPTDTSLGETAQRVIRETNRINMPPKLGFHVEKRVRELENILPLGFYYHQYYKDKNKQDILNGFEILDGINDRLIFFFDMKKGLKHFDTREYDDWSNIHHTQFVIENEPICNVDTFCNKKDNCKCVLIRNFGSKVLTDFISFYHCNDIEYKKSLIFNSLDYVLDEVWEDIGKLVFSWGCGQEPILANT